MPDDPGFYISLSVSFLSGGLVGAFITHRLALGRDRENRRAHREKEREDRLREFRRWMREWEIHIESCENSETLFSYLRVHKSSFEGQAVAIVEDIGDRNRFDELCEAVRFRGRRAGEACNQTTYESIIRADTLKAIENLIAFVKEEGQPRK